MSATDGAVKEPTGASEETKVEEVVVEKIEFTAEELEEKMQKEADRRVTQAEKKWKAEFEADKKKAIKEAIKEAEELAQLNAEERFKLEQEKERAALEGERQSFQKEKLLLETEKTLVKEQLPVDFAHFLIGADAVTTEENITKFKETFQAAVQEAVEERLRGKTPKVPGEASPRRYTREQLEGLSREEIAANWEAIEASMKNL